MQDISVDFEVDVLEFLNTLFTVFINLIWNFDAGTGFIPTIFNLIPFIGANAIDGKIMLIMILGGTIVLVLRRNGYVT